MEEFKPLSNGVWVSVVEKNEMRAVRSEIIAIFAGFFLSPLIGILAMAVLRHRSTDPGRRRAHLAWIGIFLAFTIVLGTLVALKGAAV